MKRILIIALLVCAFAVLLCVGAHAADKTGFYDVKAADGYASTVTLTPDVAQATTYSYNSKNIRLYEGAVKLTVEYKAAVQDGQYLVVAMDGTNPLPQEGNIFYIDQAAAPGTTVSFTVYPGEMVHDATYRIFLADSTGGKVIGSFKYFNADEDLLSAPTYTLGDVNNDNKLNAYDALAVLKHVAGTEPLSSSSQPTSTETQRLMQTMR